MDINKLQRWSDYWQGKPLLFPTPHAARSFVGTRRKRLEELGILINSSYGFMVDSAQLDDHLIELLATTDGYPREAA